MADRVTLLRRGRIVFTRKAAETSAGEIAEAFLAGAERPSRSVRTPGSPILVVDRVDRRSAGGRVALAGVSFSVREREIAAIVGVDGNGQDEIVEIVAGLRGPEAGNVTLSGRAISGGAFRRAGASIVPGDRQREGLILDFSIAENLRLAEPIPSADPALARRRIEEYAVRAASIDEPARALSGGNQQKVVLARELSRAPEFLLAISPTRGLDLAASRATLAALDRAADGGGAVLLVTSDLDEARAVADVLYVLYRGRLSGPFPPDTGLDRLGRAMAGVAA